MIETPQITRSDARPAAVIRLTIPRERIREVMGPGIGELLSTVAVGGRGAAGAQTRPAGGGCCGGACGC